MKISRYIIISLLLCLSIAVSGCGEKKALPEDESMSVQTTDKKENIELKLWTFFNGWSHQIQGFNTIYPEINITVENFGFDELKNEYIKALSEGNGPDILVMDSSFFGQYTVNGVLENLLEEPYSAGKYEKDFPKDVWDSNKSVDNKSVLAMTFLTSPGVTFYRADVMEENGFPSEPDEFGRFIENPENLIAIAKKLKLKDQYIFQWPTDLPVLLGSSVGFFDENLKFVRNSDEFVKVLNIAKNVHKSGFELEAGFWSEAGKKAVQDGKLVMVSNLGSWGASIIESYAPEQAGKWRVTKPPLGIKAWASDTRLAINSQSKNKEWAWKFIEYIATHQNRSENIDMVTGYIQARRNPNLMKRSNTFFGGQIVQPLFEDLGENMVQYRMTPLDDKAREIFDKEITDAIVMNIDSEKAIKDIADEIESSLAEEREILLQ
ncbi:MAG: ABC transporter substrate-binding protein [Bacillota bacterium]